MLKGLYTGKILAPNLTLQTIMALLPRISLIVDFNKTILVTFITHLVLHPGKQNITSKQLCTVPRITANVLNVLRRPIYIYIHIQFEQTISKNSIPFLDVSVILENGKLTTDLYSKPTDKHQYLYSTSCHPRHTKTSLPYCLALRLRRICSTDTLFQKRTHEMKHHLLQRGYKKGCTQDAINKASSVTREKALTNKRSQKILKRVPFVIIYNPMLPNIPKILNESHTLIF